MAKTTASSKAAKDTDTDATDEAPAPTDAPAVDEQPEPPAATAEDSAEEGPSDQLPPGVYEYVYGIGCVYPHVPLTCHAYHPAVDETETSPAIPEQPATIFEWPDGPPDDGRWAKTRRKPNQAADNAGGLLSGKE
ncbi:hypothetical protein AB0912_15730 [Streptomyces sp. NPDC007084]|uniref:hypothetical protein n=1 Tax=Streptomyces sp. NPDC007084 TaxID=3154313 RepID=UPI0034554227